MFVHASAASVCISCWSLDRDRCVEGLISHRRRRPVCISVADLSAAFDTVDHDILIRAVWIGAAVFPDILGRPAPVRPNRILGIIFDADCEWCTVGSTVSSVIQFHVSAHTSASLELQNTITNCVDDVARWMHSSRLYRHPP